MSLKGDGRDLAVKAGAKGLSVLFGLLTDRMARKRPNGLVARFRKRFGRVSESDIAETSEDFTNRIIEKSKKRR